MFNNFFKNPKYVLLFVFSITILSLTIVLPLIPIKVDYNIENSFLKNVVPESWIKGARINIDTEIGGYSLNLFGGRIRRTFEFKPGLDIAGGVSVLLEADMSQISEADRVTALESLRNIIERRVNLLGISEATVQTSKLGDTYRVIVELAGIFNTEEAISAIGQVAQLEFRGESEPKNIELNIEEGSDQQIMMPEPEFIATDLNGSDLRRANVVFDQEGITAGAPLIELQFNAEGTKKFRDITSEYLNKRLAIYLDDQILIAPTVQTVINDGRAVISGQFSVEEARLIAAQLNAGALPVPVNVLEQRTIGPTLGQESVNRSIYAGIVGLILVICFMVVYYQRLGLLAVIALLIYGTLTLALYKFIPVVITLPGLAGFILSIGMAVDANILIFERIKEELRQNKPYKIALENGFDRAWNSVRDANLATLTTAFILFNPFDWGFLPTSGPVRGFALTLGIGIILSLFTGVFVTRNLVRVFYNPKTIKTNKEDKND